MLVLKYISNIYERFFSCFLQFMMERKKEKMCTLLNESDLKGITQIAFALAMIFIQPFVVNET